MEGSDNNMLSNEILGGGKKRNRRKTHKKGGFGLTGAVSTGLLLAAEELYRESLKKHNKKHGGSDQLSSHLVDQNHSMNLLDSEQLLNGGRRRHRRMHKKGGDASSLNGHFLENRDGALLSEAFDITICG